MQLKALILKTKKTHGVRLANYVKITLQFQLYRRQPQ